MKAGKDYLKGVQAGKMLGKGLKQVKLMVKVRSNSSGAAKVGGIAVKYLVRQQNLLFLH